MIKYSTPSSFISCPEGLAEQHGVSGLDIERYASAVLAGLAEPRRQDLAVLWFLFGGIRNDDRAALFR